MPILAELRARPFLLFALAMGIALTTKFHPWHLVFLLPVLIAAKEWWHRGVCALLAVLGIVLSPAPVRPLYQTTRVDGMYVVKTVPRIGAESSWVIIEGDDGRYALKTASNDLSLGDHIRLRAAVMPIREGGDEFWLSKGVIGSIYDLRGMPGQTSMEIVSRGSLVFRWGIAWRASFMRMTESNLSREDADLIDALCFNVDSGLDGPFRDELRRTGVIHIISASGLHVMVFALTLQWAFRKLPFQRTIQLVLLLAILLIYAGATGFRPPVVRAVVMAAMLLGAYLFKREGDLLSAAGVAALGQLLIDPWAVFDVGFYLSFVTIIALGLFLPMGPLRTTKEKVKRGLQASAVATVASAPIVGCTFGSISLIGVLANLIIGPFILPLVAGSLVAWGANLFMPSVAGMILTGTASLGAAVRFCVHNLSQIPFAAVELPPYFPYLIPVFYAACLVGWRLKKRPA